MAPASRLRKQHNLFPEFITHRYIFIMTIAAVQIYYIMASFSISLEVVKWNIVGI